MLESGKTTFDKFMKSCRTLFIANTARGAQRRVVSDLIFYDLIFDEIVICRTTKIKQVYFLTKKHFRRKYSQENSYALTLVPGTWSLVALEPTTVLRLKKSP